MPLYTVTLPSGKLNAPTKATLAGKITDLHCDMSGVPPEWVHVVFAEYAEGCAFTGGKPAVTVSLTVLIRSGRSPDYKREMLQRLGAALKEVSGASDEEIVIGIIEVPPSQAMEMGKVMPEI